MSEPEFIRQRRREWEDERQVRATALLNWKAARTDKLAAMHPGLQNEIVAVAWDRIKAGEFDPQLTPREIRDAEKRVVSRMRLKAYGPIEDTAVDEWLRQTNEIRAKLGLSHVARPTPKAAA